MSKVVDDKGWERTYGTYHELQLKLYWHMCICRPSCTHSFDTQKLLHRGAFTHKRACTQTRLHTKALTHRSFYTEQLLHRKICTQNSVCLQVFFAHDRRFWSLYTQELCTQKLLHIHDFPYRNFCAETLFHTEAFTQTSFLRADAPAHRSMYTKKSLHREASTHGSFTQGHFYARKILHRKPMPQKSYAIAKLNLYTDFYQAFAAWSWFFAT